MTERSKTGVTDATSSRATSPSLPMILRQSRPRILPQSFDNSRYEFLDTTGCNVRMVSRVADLAVVEEEMPGYQLRRRRRHKRATPNKAKSSPGMPGAVKATDSRTLMLYAVWRNP